MEAIFVSSAAMITSDAISPGSVYESQVRTH